MRNSFVISDTHFSHENTWAKFKLADGTTPLRPFSSTEEMDEAMVSRWNAKVRPQDYVYHLGDVAISKRGLKFVERLNGHKRLIMGNHDIHPYKMYLEAGFEKICGVRVFTDKFILSHIPLHPDCITERFKVNVHGHLHANEVMKEDLVRMDEVDPETGMHYYTLGTQIDPRYLCVSVEHTNYEPLSFDEVEARIAKRWEETGYQPPERAGWGNGSGPN